MAATAAVEDLLALHPSEKDPEIRKDIVRALGPCGAGNDTAKLIVLESLDSPKESLRAAAALSAGALVKGDPQVAAAIEGRFRKERAQGVRLALLFGLGESGDEAQVKLLERMVAKEKDDDLIKIAAVTRARLEGKSLEQAGKVLGKGGGKELRRLLGAVYDDDKIVRNFIRETDRKVSGKQ
jgi:HEAT repeat protein